MDLMKIIKALSSRMMDETLQRLCDGDEDYNAELNKAVELQKQYEELRLKDEDKKVIDDLLESRDCANMERVSLAYLAGLEDCIRILWELNVLQV